MLSLTRVLVSSLVWEVRSHLKACVPSPIMYVLCAPGKNSGACCHFLFQGILTQGSNPCLWCLLHILHSRRILSQLGFMCPQPHPPTPKMNFTQMESASQKGACCRTTDWRSVTEELSIMDPKVKIFNRERVTNDNPQEEKVYTASATRIDYPSNSVNENWSSLLNSDFSFQTKLRSPLLFSIMFFFFVGLPYGFFFFNSSLVPNCNNSTISE